MFDSGTVSMGVFWFGLALITAGLAQQKNRNRLIWFVAGLFLGPLATALVVVWDPPESEHSGVGDSVRRYRAARAAQRSREA